MRSLRISEAAGGDFRTVNEAYAAITDATADNAYRLDVEPVIGSNGSQLGLPTLELPTRDHIDLNGYGEQPVWLRGYQPAGSALTDIANKSTLRGGGQAKVGNFLISAQNARYAFHGDHPSLAGKAAVFERVWLHHLGNEEVRAYWIAQGFAGEVDTWGSPHYVWQSTCAAGLGMWPDAVIAFRQCDLRSPRGGTLLCHSHAGPTSGGAVLEIADSRIESMSGEQAIMLQSYGSGRDNVCRLSRNTVIGSATATINAGTEQEWLVVHDDSGVADVAGARQVRL